MICVLQKCPLHKAFNVFWFLLWLNSVPHYIIGFAGTEESSWILDIFLVCHHFTNYELMLRAFCWFCCTSLKLYNHTVHKHSNFDSLLPTILPFTSAWCLMASDRISRTVLHNNAEIQHFCLFLVFIGRFMVF